MAYYPLPLRFFVPLSLLLLWPWLSGCCANNVCNCDDARQDSIALKFNYSAADTVSAGQFRAADLDTIILKRYPNPRTAANKFDSLTVIRPAARAGDTLYLANNAPFAQAGNAKVSGYSYVVQYLARLPRKGTGVTVLTINRVQLAGSFEGSGCCTCYQNTRKLVYVDTVTVPRDLTARHAVLTVPKR